MIFNYALQVRDTAQNQALKRYASDNRTEISIKCITSFFESVKYITLKKPEVTHNIMIYDDNSSLELKDFLTNIKNHYSSNLMNITLDSIENSGIMNSIRSCWNWLGTQTGDLVYQVQDDYLFTQDAIYQMVDIFYQIYNDKDHEAIINPYNDPNWWVSDGYRYKSTPRVIVPGCKQYWIQCYDISCSFMTSKNQFNKHWDIYNKFLNMSSIAQRLEADSLNKILVTRGVLGLTPFESVALHMQADTEKDFYIDWKKRWDSIPNIKGTTND